MRQQLARSLSGPIRLWLVVVVLWAGATLFRTNRFWAPDSNPAESWGNPWVWIDLFVPPILFAVAGSYQPRGGKSSPVGGSSASVTVIQLTLV